MTAPMPKDNEVDEKVVAYGRDLDGTGSLHPCAKGDSGAIALYDAATVAELRAEVAYYKENFQSCMTTLNAINDAITEADEDGRGFVPVNQLENILTGADPT